MKTAMLIALGWSVAAIAQQPTAADIIKKSVAANQEDFKAAPLYNWKETDRTGKGAKTYQIEMIGGSPYYRLIAMNGKPLSGSQEAEEKKKWEQVTQSRSKESREERERRIQKYEKERRRDEEMMSQMAKAFIFTLVGQQKLKGFDVWNLKATPSATYKPTSMATQVLTGMQGELWIDVKTNRWVRVTAQVVHPVAIAGFLAKVQPGTRFEFDKAPVPGGFWLASHFGVKSDAKILGVVNKASQEEVTFFDYVKKTAGAN